jgi:hypothetical protein
MWRGIKTSIVALIHSPQISSIILQSVSLLPELALIPKQIYDSRLTIYSLCLFVPFVLCHIFIQTYETIHYIELCLRGFLSKDI